MRASPFVRYCVESEFYAMLRSKSLLLALLCQLVSVDAGFSYDWSNWIIVPANSKTNVGSGREFDGLPSGFSLNRSQLVRSYLDYRQPEPVVMGGGRERSNYRQKKFEKISDGHESSDLVVHLGRAIDTVKNFCAVVRGFFDEDNESTTSAGRKVKKVKKKYKKFLLPLLMAYKLKFLTLIPVLIGGLILLVGTTGLAGFFFALFTAVMSLKSENKVEVKNW